jgi:hypothetical protein
MSNIYILHKTLLVRKVMRTFTYGSNSKYLFSEWSVLLLFIFPSVKKVLMRTCAVGLSKNVETFSSILKFICDPHTYHITFILYGS